MNFNGKTVIVTGASSGIGKAIALSFGKLEANVVVNYKSNLDTANDVVNEIKASGGNAIAFQANVVDLAVCESMVKEAKNVFGSVDVLVNNSGITKDNLIIRMKETDFDQVIDVNLKGTWNMSKSVARLMMKQRGGSIINISSVVGLIGNPGQTNYVASKAGIIGITKSLSKELGVRGVRVNAVAPGFIETKMTDELEDSIKDAYLSQIPMGKFGQTEDIANAVLFLASDNAAYITGQVLSVNGGMI